MKKILVIGANSYIGKSFENYAKNKYEITMVNSRNDEWKSVDFTGFDSVLHCAGIAHVKQTNDNKNLYYKINCDLAIDVAKKAKKEGVKQFIFLSSLFVYVYRNCDVVIRTNTTPKPDTIYGKSKLKAENELRKLTNDNFKLCIVRPPMVYGKNCKGNFSKLVKLAKMTPIFPDFPNKRSMIYIENLCEFFCKIIEKLDDENVSFFHPQNSEYVCTTELVKAIRAGFGKCTRTTKLFNPIVKLLIKKVGFANKMFGDLVYEFLGDEGEYFVVGFEESVEESLRMINE